MEWQLQDAKNQLSKVVQKARHEVRQIVTRRVGRPSLVDDLLFGPGWDDVLAKDVKARNKTPNRDVAF
ncbi:type II toxin-antitoxin system prevent-host-death family antitoxin [Rhizobium sp. BK251]|uniref:type II toxin-antitoxin system prevent-host-death family antitoxin n=1 Tax=Rhizobium sp. BK251 TaxID=2512125 RepID=UPI001044D64F|nr:type II toxin-antitoxin system prevent-host-death family antitoxin [Rhizobium sp. BK251]TCL63656.1 prevent-host-death family protein [Rhizobium sp. BK251]